jgi:integrase/recombinase XerD
MKPSDQARFDILYQQHLNVLKLQGKADVTIDAYSRAVRRVSAFFDCCPDQLNEHHLRDYFLSLVQSHSWSTVKLDRNGLQFFYRHILNKPWQWVDIVKPPKVTSLPDILSVDEVSRVINQTRELRYQTYLLCVYSMGLRLSEALNLTIADIDSARMKLHVRCGKGRKDRFVTLPQRTLDLLRFYWSTHRNPTLLFPRGKTETLRHLATQPMDRGGLQKSTKAIVKSCGIHKRITIHTFRHCYGAHLVEVGVNLRVIQHQMGHQCPKTTALYTQLTQTTQSNTDQLINRLINQLQFAQASSQTDNGGDACNSAT